jgi:uncharacterized protein
VRDRAALSFFAAVRAGDLPAVEAALARDPELAGARDAQGLSALLVACYHRQDAVRDALLDAGHEPDVLEAAAVGDLPRLAARLAADPEAVRARAPDGFTALHYAAFFGGAAAVGALLAAGADPNAEAGPGLRPLHSAAAARDLEAARRLLAAGAAPDARQAGGFTALHAAAQHDDLALAEELLRHGADPGVAADDGRDARAMAAPAVRERLGRA